VYSLKENVLGHNSWKIDYCWHKI